MQNDWTDRWNDRYKSATFAYGEVPNNYFKEKLDTLKPGTILLPAEGEGRNAVYAATRGWKVSAFDISDQGKKKAELLATRKKVEIDYVVATLEELKYAEAHFDAMAFIYAHFPANLKSHHNRTLTKHLKTGGTLIFEAFSKRHIEYISKNEKVGGPKEIDMLFSKEELLSDFDNFDIEEVNEVEIELNEGEFHQGIGSVIRFTGRKR